LVDLVDVDPAYAAGSFGRGQPVAAGVSADVADTSRDNAQGWLGTLYRAIAATSAA
jgi:hypothetical protein